MSNKHNVFISWSGPSSQCVAEAIRDWLPLIIQAAKPWMSDKDIAKGSRGLNEISEKLEGVKAGIVCLTPDNLNAPWILYESGALTKIIDGKTRLCTYLLGGLRPEDVSAPLSMFQATISDEKDTFKLVSAINDAVSTEPLSETQLKHLFDKLWPELKEKIKAMPSPRSGGDLRRSPEDMTTELLGLVRGQVQSAEEMRARLAHIDAVLDRAPFGGPMTSLYGTLTNPLTSPLLHANLPFTLPTAPAFSFENLNVPTPKANPEGGDKK